MEAAVNTLLSALALVCVSSLCWAADQTGLQEVTACLRQAAAAHSLPPAALVLLYENEGGSLGQVSRNSNGTVDIGPLQINQIWVGAVARRWGLPADTAFRLLRDDFCSNAEAAAWILQTEIRNAGGDFWEGMGRYHSARFDLKERYLAHIHGWVRRIQRAIDDG
jgi:hypothetical protein